MVKALQKRQCRWTAGDLVDLELALDADSSCSDENQLHQRDRKYFSEILEEVPEKIEFNRFDLLYQWLEKRRHSEWKNCNSPGQEMDLYLRVLRPVLFLSGFLCAKYLIWELFAESSNLLGKIEPVNVLSFIFFGVLLPLLFSIGLLYLFVTGTLFSGWFEKGKTRSLLFSALIGMLKQADRRFRKDADPGLFWTIHSLRGSLRMQLMHRGSLLQTQLSCVAQYFGLGLVTGTVLIPWFDVLVNSRIFGWQSTYLSISAETLFPLIDFLSAPWHAFWGEGVGFPSQEQVAATRFSLLRDVSFPEIAAPAWANFMIFSAFMYGFLPRVFLCLLYKNRLRYQLSRLTFNELRYDAVIQRMKQPIVEWDAGDEGSAPVISNTVKQMAMVEEPDLNTFILRPNDLDNENLNVSVLSWFEKEKSWLSPTFLSFGLRQKQKEDLLAQLPSFDKTSEPVRFILLQEDYMPPSQSLLTFIQHLRTVRGVQDPFHIALLGKPGESPFGEAPHKRNIRIWKDKMQTLGDTNLDVMTFIKPMEVTQ